jgi:hypothetical protein
METPNLLATVLDIGRTQGEAEAEAVKYLSQVFPPLISQRQRLNAKTLKSLTLQINAGNTAARQGLANPLQQSWTGGNQHCASTQQPSAS